MMSTSRIPLIETFVNSYVDCWRPNAPNLDSGSIFENNDFGCENNQVFRNNLNIETFTHDELCSLSWLLTRELRGQINMDHYIFWSWCSSIVDLQAVAKGFCSGHWLNDDYDIVKAFDVNDHTLVTYLNRYLLAGPLCCSILEGVLRRKNGKYVDRNGVVICPFKLGKTQFSPIGHSVKGRHNMNQMTHSFRLFEDYVIRDRGRSCTGLNELNNETLGLFPTSLGNIYELIGSWRNSLQHGNTFWQNRVPLLLNYICLMFLDEFEPAIFNSSLVNFKQHFDWRMRTPRIVLDKLNMPYPPDF